MVVRGRRWAVAWCVVLVACGGSTNTEKGRSSNDGGSGNDGGIETGGRTSTGGRSTGSGAAASTGGAGATTGAGGIANTGGVLPGTGGALPAAGGALPATGGTTPATGGTGGTGGFGGTGGSEMGGSGGELGGSGGCFAPFCNTPDPEPPGKVFCGGVECAANETCCFATLKCFDAKKTPEACKSLPPAEPDPNNRTPCSSNADCDASEYCEVPLGPFSDTMLCGGAGFCQSRTNCGASSGMTLCGCDGRTYPNIQTACFYGARIANVGECGKETTLPSGDPNGRTVTLCGADSQCPQGQHCCTLLGECYAADRAAVCALPPPGASRACLTSRDCTSGNEYCAGEGCTSVGGCVPLVGCGAVLEPVCGCDGKTYVNAECAASTGMRISKKGNCTP